MPGIQEYKCPACGGVLEFNSTIQKMQCRSCGTEIEVAALEAANQQTYQESADDMTWDTGTGEEWDPAAEDGMKTYVCESCGGEIMADESTAATSCPFCGNQVVLTDRVSGQLRPDYVIPFKLNKEQAKEAYRRHLRGKTLLPRSFFNENRIDEIKGVYVPYWLFDTDADASIRYRGEKKAVWDDGKFIYTRTSYYSILRTGGLSFRKVPVDGSKKVADELMESIEPFNFEEAVDFQTAYLSGYLADRYDIPLEEGALRVNVRIRESTEEAFEETVTGYQSLQKVRSNINLHNNKATYALYPVWLLNTTWRGKKFTFAMNGQTGKMVGDLPADAGRTWSWRIGITAAVTLIGAVIMFFV